MNEEKAKEILKSYIQPDGGLYCLGHYMDWPPGDKEITLDCRFELEELEAIAWWVRNSSNAAVSNAVNGPNTPDGTSNGVALYRMVRRDEAATAEMAARVSNDISEGYDNGESRADLRACLKWWASRCSDLTMVYRAVEGAAVTLEVTTWRESDKPAVTARELLKDARARGEKTINA